MSAEMIQIVVLAAIALVLVLRLRNVLGTRGGFEKPDAPAKVRPQGPGTPRPMPVEGEAEAVEVIEDVPGAAPATLAALRAIREAEPDFSAEEFLSGARQAHEMIVSGFETGDLDSLRGLIAPEVEQGFAEAIAARRERGLTVEFRYIGLRDAAITDAAYNPASKVAEVTVRFTAEITSALRDAQGAVVDGDPLAVRRQVDVFTFERQVGSPDPNWTLVSTGA